MKWFHVSQRESFTLSHFWLDDPMTWRHSASMLSPRCCDALRGESIGRLSICRVCAILSTNQNAATVSTSGVSDNVRIVFHSIVGLNINFISSRNNAISYQLLRHHIYVKYFAFFNRQNCWLDSIAMLMKGTADKVFGDFILNRFYVML